MQLLPGPTDREGLPESIRFWKSRMERTDSDTTFAVGLSYGPSGCGKSSLMKAGVLPRLAPRVHAVYLEATPDDTEARLLKLLRKACGAGVPPAESEEAGATPAPQPAQPLVDMLAALRRGRGLAPGEKVVIVLDQFEQWLHSHREAQGTELVRALRQCDGGRVQCVVMVRDDFWMAASRFLRELEIPLVEGENSAATDLFDTRHARRVLALFGRAFGCLPSVGNVLRGVPDSDGGRSPPRNATEGVPYRAVDELTADQERFLDAAVAGLAEDGKVVSVRLALFAEMVKSKPWTPVTLKEIGGIAGVGATFLEETFSASTAPPRHRLHQQAARAVLKALLPEAGADIKGHQRGALELLAASGYERRPDEFAELLRILDSELRLITPADEEGDRLQATGDRGERGALTPCSDGNTAGVDPSSASSPIQNPQSKIQNHFQLTHDYLVPSLRDWLTRKQRETRRGRAELRLAERAAAYGAKPDARFLPSGWEWPNILLFTKRGKWTTPERRVMRAAAKYHGLRFTGLLVVVTMLVFMGLAANRRNEARRAETLAESVFAAPADAVRYTLDNLRPMRRLALPRLRAKFDDRNAGAVQRLHAAYALADLGGDPQEFLLDAAATAPAGECRNLVEAFEHIKGSALAELARRAESAADPGAKARFAIVALQLGNPKPAQQALALRGDPSHRTALIHGFAAWHGDVAHMAALVAASDDPAFRSGLCAALGTIAPPPSERDAAVGTLLQLYTGDHDGGTHAAAGWTLRQWEQTPPTIKPASRPPSDRRWFVNRQGMTMVEIAEGTFTMGTAAISGQVDQKPAYEVALTRAFYLADREVTVEQFQKFLDDPGYPAAEKPNDWKWADWMKQSSTTPDCPMNGVSWFDTVLYCNWLSTREGRKPCYERTGEKEKLKNYDGTEAEYDVWRCDFAADGYRLPTEAEWEYASRAKSSEGFCYGADEDLLPQYAWFSVNGKSRTWPGGAKLPNAFGLFDMHGNVWEWCWDWQADYPAETVSDPTGPAA
ncbi:MAG TPA: SUMF1/EgtB/PvdO family nonheme iron enzyme, partial [Pirellulales bacterium]|nr:SUMF1/EgtB/PvdO family nonheme iron enzyme [Pirellulales bacterium]